MAPATIGVPVGIIAATGRNSTSTVAPTTCTTSTASAVYPCGVVFQNSSEERTHPVYLIYSPRVVPEELLRRSRRKILKKIVIMSNLQEILKTESERYTFIVKECSIRLMKSPPICS